MNLAISEPLPPNDPMHLSRPVLCQDDRAPWIGQKATGPHRATGVVHRVYSTPFGVQVALLETYNRGLSLQVTELLSTATLPATHRTAYLRNYRTLLNMPVPELGTSARRTAAWHRRAKLYTHYDFALKYVEAALLEHVQAGDELVYRLGTRMVVLDPDLDRDRLFGWRRRMRVRATSEHQDTVRRWGWTDGEDDLFLRHDGLGPLPTLGLL
ncbi:hypothetical protein ACIBBE_24735 [Streptomyces sp. NPDC051644]|uniref:hypothetical protein n=1 Tax=Streptomyces sp. NPDC051644 TaxID=3365666 RepID=UPI0037B4B40B